MPQPDRRYTLRSLINALYEAPGIFDQQGRDPFQAGADQTARGLQTLTGPSERMAGDPRWWDEKAMGAAEAIRGTTPFGLAAMPLAVSGAPLGALVRGLAGGLATQQGGEYLGRQAGMPQGQAELFGQMTGLLGGAAGAGTSPGMLRDLNLGSRRGSATLLPGRPDITLDSLTTPNPLLKGLSDPDGNLQALSKYITERYGPEAQKHLAEARAFHTRINGQPPGTSALKPNTKTYMSCDPSGICVYEDLKQACPQCYVTNPRAQNEIFKTTGSKTGKVMADNENWAKASKAYDTAPYNDEILQMPEAVVNFFNDRQGGLRMFSSGDWRLKDKATIDRMMAHADQKGLYIKPITKQDEFVQLYGDRPNVRMNVSSDFNPDNAWQIAGQNRTLREVIGDPSAVKMISNGFPINRADALKARYPNLRSRYVAVNQQDGIKSVMDPRVDVLTMYHGSDDPATLVNLWDKTNPGLRSATVNAAGEKVPARLGPRTTGELSESFQATPDVKKWMHGVTQQDIDEVFGPDVFTVKEWRAKAAKKLCCQTGKCGTTGARCGFETPGKEK